ncbi:hypothetical protein DFH09DRAFT_337738 [Mycena vulgaris]|nr:hypothetical protein DFH09DRAFT_337738 [Mycena vulgaris]
MHEPLTLPAPSPPLPQATENTSASIFAVSDSTATDQAPPKAPFLPFRSQCGRRGCTYVLRYEGMDPFVALATMVNAHRSHCFGRDFGTTHRCDTGWAPTEEMGKQWEMPAGDAARSTSQRATDIDAMDCDTTDEWDQPAAMPISERKGGATDMDCLTARISQQYRATISADDTATSTSEGKAGATGMDCNTARTGQQCRAADRSADKVMQDGDDKVVHNAHGELPVRRRSYATMHPRRKSKGVPATTAKRTSKKVASPQTQRPRKKKSAHTEAQRKAALEADPWTLKVEFTKLVCRGCGRTIRLDGRSRYYPGLWWKHRENCERVRSGCALLDQPEQRKTDAICSDAEGTNRFKTVAGVRCHLEDVEMAAGTLGSGLTEFRWIHLAP